jgi:hypothetical protein
MIEKSKRERRIAEPAKVNKSRPEQRKMFTGKESPTRKRERI